MSTIIQSQPPMDQPPEITRNATGSAKETLDRLTEDARGLAGAAAETAGDIADVGKDAAKRATDAARHIYQLSAVKAEETLAISKEYVRRNPLPVILGAVAVGAALGYMLMMSRRRPTFGERYAAEPMAAVRDAILGALAPVTQRVHDGYDSAMDGAGKAIHRLSSGRASHSFSDRLGRIGENLKFW